MSGSVQVKNTTIIFHHYHYLANTTAKEGMVKGEIDHVTEVERKTKELSGLFESKLQLSGEKNNSEAWTRLDIGRRSSHGTRIYRKSRAALQPK